MRQVYGKVKSKSINRLRVLFKNARSGSDVFVDKWKNLQNKILRFNGRGGKGHLRTGSVHRWNRKGRW